MVVLVVQGNLSAAVFVLDLLNWAGLFLKTVLDAVGAGAGPQQAASDVVYNVVMRGEARVAGHPIELALSDDRKLGLFLPDSVLVLALKPFL